MDTVLIEKLKQNFQTERREQVLKGKDLQKETQQRRRTMEMKAQLEAAKEEKRRQEALAERKARHIEATMRFQKGLKHFKFNKERISLEQVLRNIQPPASPLNQQQQQNGSNHRIRLNSADEYEPNSNYYFSTNSANSVKLNHLKKSSSFESLNSLLNNNYNINSDMRPSSNNQMIIEQMKLNNTNNKNNNNNNNNVTISQHLNAYNPETLTENTNFKVNRHHIQNIIYNEKNNNDVMSKENLKDFQNLVANELNNNNNHNRIIKVNPKQHFYDTSNVLTVDDYRNGLYNKHDNKQEADDDQNSTTDSMETDSLLNLNLDNNNNNTVKLSTNNRIDGESDTNDELLFLNNNIKKKESINHLNSNYNSHVDASNLWFSSNLALNTNNNNNKLKAKTSQQQQQQLKFHQQPTTNQTVIKQPITVTHANNRNNSAGNIKENNNNNNHNKEIKSILKRSTSLENNLTVVNYAVPSNQIYNNNNNTNKHPSSDNNLKNVGIVKDSLDVTNMRKIKNESESNETNGKKSVRFATQLYDSNNINNNENINKTEISNQQQQQQQPIEYKTSTQATLNLAQPTAEDQRISSTNSIRRPVIKSKNAIINGYNKNGTIKSDDIVTTTTIIASPKIMNSNYKIDDYTVNSEKPPAHPNSYMLLNSAGSSSSTSGGSSSYSIIGQKRRELLLQQQQLQRNKLNSGGSSSCSSSMGTTSGSGGSSGLLINDRLLLNSPKQNGGGVNIKIDVAPSHTTTTNNNYSTPTILPLNRLTSLTSPSPISSPNQFFPMPILNSSQTSSSLTNNSNNNYNNHFSNNSKLIEGNYREYQLSKQQINNNNVSSVPSTPTSVNNTIRLNNNTVIDMNLYKKLDISNYLDQQHQLNQIYNREYYSNNINNNNNKFQPEYNQIITKMPLSPKQNKHEQIILRRPTPTENINNNNNNNNTMFTSKPPTPPNATPTATFTQLMSPKIMSQQQQQQQQNLNDVPKTNIRFAYINSPLSSTNPTTNNNTNSENQMNKNNPNTIHLEIKYPLYSNQPSQNTQYINIAKPISRQTSFESDQKTIPVTISVEEQNVKNSILRLNERLNMLQNQRYTSNGDYLNGTNYDNLNKHQKNNGRPITTNITKLRR